MKPVGVSTPAWSFVGEKQVEVKKMTNVPGPGAHQISTGERATWEAAPKWVFGTSGRTDWTGGNVVPGPGEYFDKEKEARIYEEDKQNLFGKMHRSENVNKHGVPGPGSYQHKLVAPELPKYSFGYKFEGKEYESDNPLGPGQYDSDFNHKEFKKANKFGKSLRIKHMSKSQQANPGPNAYRPGEIKETTSTKGTFGKAKRTGIYQTAYISPGPAAYRLKNHTITETIEKTKGYSIAGKYGSNNQTTANSTPGPGEYNPTQIKTKEHAPQYRFGSGLRPDLNVDYTKAPGPGTYYRDKDMMDVEERLHLKGPKIKDPIYIPGQLTHPEIPNHEKFLEWDGHLQKVGKFNTQPKFSFSGKRDGPGKRGEYKTPGPGAYDPSAYDPDNDQRIEGHTPIIGTSMRPNLDKRNNVPGPGHYYPTDMKLGSMHKFGKMKKNKHVDADDPDMMPGPGKYNINHTIPQIQYW